MEFKELIKGRPVWYNKELNSEKDTIAVTFQANGKKYVVLDEMEEEPWEFDLFKAVYSLTEEDALKRYNERDREKKELIKKIYEIEQKLSQLTDKFRDDFGMSYITRSELEAEREKQRFKDNLRKMCLMLNVSSEFFDFHARNYYSQNKEARRRENLGMIGVYEKE